MTNPTVYRLVNKSGNKVAQFRDPSSLVAHMLGKRISAYLVIKSDERGDRLVTFASADVDAMETALRAS